MSKAELSALDSQQSVQCAVIGIVTFGRVMVCIPRRRRCVKKTEWIEQTVVSRARLVLMRQSKKMVKIAGAMVGRLFLEGRFAGPLKRHQRNLRALESVRIAGGNKGRAGILIDKQANVQGADTQDITGSDLLCFSVAQRFAINPYRSQFPLVGDKPFVFSCANGGVHCRNRACFWQHKGAFRRRANTRLGCRITGNVSLGRNAQSIGIK